VEAMKTTAQVPMEVQYQPAWLTWVASATTCLRALGVDCDTADVAGLTGYAFVTTVHDELCPSGPTMFDWGMLDHGINMLGRSTLVFSSSDCHTKDGRFGGEHTREHCRVAFELVAREVSEGRPCVLWGAYVPEFAVAVGVDDGKYLVRSFKEVTGDEQPPIAFDDLDAPGGPYVMAFPTATNIRKGQLWGDCYAVGLAVQLLNKPSAFRRYGTGLKAFDVWVRALEQNKADPFGNAYNAQCWAEARRLARDFLARVAERNPAVADSVTRAHEAYVDSAAAMRRVAELFPFPAKDGVASADNRQAAIAALRDAQAAETKAAAALMEAVETDWESAAAAAG